MLNAQEVIKLLGMRPLAEEGGFFVEMDRSRIDLPRAVLPPEYAGPRSLSTAIYYLLTTNYFSRLHKLASAETYHFYLGDPVEMLILKPDGSAETPTLGIDLEAGMRPQITVPARMWQGSFLAPGGKFGYALLGTTMAPGYAQEDFELGSRDALIRRFPECADGIKKLTDDGC